jgi:hypothetical protein
MTSKRLRVRLLSGDVVYDGCAPRSLTQLREEVAAATMGCEWKDELVFCSGDTVLDCIEDVGDEITAVRDPVMGLLGEFLRHAYKSELPERLWPVREHRRLILAAVAINGHALQHASPELRADRAVVLAAVETNSHALVHASAELRADRDVVLAAVAHNGYVLQYASPELRANRDFVLAAVASSSYALRYASAELRADRVVVMAALENDGHALQYASPELQADQDVVLAAVARSSYALRYASAELQADQNVVLAAYASAELRADRDVALDSSSISLSFLCTESSATSAPTWLTSSSACAADDLDLFSRSRHISRSVLPEQGRPL